MTEETLTKVVVDCSTNTSEVIPLTEEEVAEYHARVQAALEREAQKEAEAAHILELKDSARAKLINGEPLTEEEAAVIVL
jgi:hypothetical protein